MSLLAAPIRWAWIAVYLGIVGTHCAHAVRVRGEGGAWHAGHVVMAVGMAAMFAPAGLNPFPTLAWEAVFGACTVLVLGWLVRTWRTRRAVGSLWVLSLVEMTAMTYMLALPGIGNGALTAGLVVYFLAVAVAWLAGAFDAGAVVPTTLDPRRGAGARPSLVGATSTGERATFAVMALGMAYMFVAMGTGL